jgi:hypothetical protein
VGGDKSLFPRRPLALGQKDLGCIRWAERRSPGDTGARSTFLRERLKGTERARGSTARGVSGPVHERAEGDGRWCQVAQPHQ